MEESALRHIYLHTYIYLLNNMRQHRKFDDLLLILGSETACRVLQCILKNFFEK
jgi:hypothetical protein